MVGKFNGKNSSMPTTNCSLMNPFWRTQRKSNLKKNVNGGGASAKEVDETNYGFRPNLGHSMGIQHNQKEKEEGRATANDYVPLEMPFLKKPSICAADKKLKKAKFAGGNEDEGEYEEIDNFIVDIFRLKNRELLKNMQNKNGKSENKINGMENAANKFGGSAKNIFTNSKEGLPRQFCRSTLDLNFYYKNSSTENGQINGKMISPTILPAPFPTTMNAHKSTVAGKSCKQQIAQQQIQRSFSPEYPKKVFGQFNRTISCQNLNNDNFELQNSVKYAKQNVHRRGSHANNEKFEGQFSAADKFGAEISSMSVLQRFPKMRIEPAPNLPKRQSSKNEEEIVGKMLEKNNNKKLNEEEKDGAWRKAEINLQKLINTMEEKTKSSYNYDTGYMEVPLKNGINKNSNNENDYDELGQLKGRMAENKQTKILNMELENVYDEIGWQNIHWNGSKNFKINNFMDKFLTSKIREMALWMCEADCQAFGWPPSKKPGQQSHFWSIDENGTKIRREIMERSKFVQNLVSNSLDYPKSSSLEILEKWIELTKELFNEFGNIFAFMNIFGILIEKMMGKFPAFFDENQKLVAAYNSIKNGDKIDGNGQILLPFIQPYFDELSDGKLEENFEELNLNAKIDFLWTMTKLGRKMFAKMEEKCAKNEREGENVKIVENIFGNVQLN